MVRRRFWLDWVLIFDCCIVVTVEANDHAARPIADARSDLVATHTIFGDASLSANTRSVVGNSQLLSPSRRLDLLADWVLPTPEHPTFRLDGCFAGNGPSPLHRSDMSRVVPHEVREHSQSSETDRLICPAVALVAAAGQQGQLAELRERVLAYRHEDASQAYYRACLLFLIAAESTDVGAASKAFERLFQLSETLDRNRSEVRWPAVLVLHAALPDPALRRIAGEPLFGLYVDAGTWTPDERLDAANDHIRSLAGRYRQLDSGSDSTVSVSAPSADSQWVRFGYADAQTRGSGRPDAQWSVGRGLACQVSGHEVDYLSYGSPLLGDCEVECEFSTHDGERVAFMVAGTCVEAFDDRGTLRVTSYRRDAEDVAVETSLTPFDKWARYRAVVHDGVLTHYFNGAPVLTRALPEHHDPWFAVRMWRRSHGQVRDVRISGDPVIPHEIRLTGDADLPGWIPYFETGFGIDSNAWRGQVDDGRVVIHGEHRPELSGSHLQRLLRYCRPMVEDGSIEYEFFYSPGRFAVHPALDRLAVLLEPAGAQRHWITDGRFEQSDVDPGNIDDSPQQPRRPGRLPLIEEAWNRVALTLRGDRLQVRLNEKLVFEQAVESDNPRTFGLFHYADRTQARVRNVVWRGEWPRSLPSIDQQQLASSDLDFLNERLSAMTAEFRHDFREGAPSERFDFNGDQTTLHTVDGGLRAERISNRDGLREIRGCLQVHGDFDITATFSDLEIQMPQPRWNAGIGLRLFLDDPDESILSLYRRLSKHQGNNRVAYYHSHLMPDGTRDAVGDNQAEDSDSGRLRISRRGEWMYGLYAAHDSPNFRLIGKQRVTTDPIAVQGVRLAFQQADSVDIRLTWRILLIKAEKISGLPVADPEPVISRLEARRRQQRDASVDLSDPDIIGNQTRITASDGATTDITAKGVRMTATSQTRTESAQLLHMLPLVNATDVETQLSIDRLDVSERMGLHCECTMQVMLESPPRGQNHYVPLEAALLVHQKANGIRDLTARVVYLNSFGQRVWRVIRSVEVESPNSLRIAIDGKTIYFLYSESGSDDQHVIATAGLDGPVYCRSVSLKATSNGQGRTSDATWKRLGIRGDVVDSSEELD